jgi:hypothetical protein
MPTDHFSRTSGSFTLYTGSEKDHMAQVRFCLARFGEDPDKVLKAFWTEHKTGDFAVVPLFAYGLPPRRELCTPKSLSSALAQVDLQPGGLPWMKWKALADQLNVTWPVRLREKAASAA